MKQKITIPVDNVLQYLSVWNGIFNLTPMELKVLATFINTDDLLGSDNLCCYNNKKATALAIGITDPNTLNNYVKKLFEDLFKYKSKSFIQSLLLFSRIIVPVSLKNLIICSFMPVELFEACIVA